MKSLFSKKLPPRFSSPASIQPRLLRLCALALLLITLVSQAYSRVPLGAASSANSSKRKAYSEHARQSIATLNRDWLKSSPRSATWDGINAWQRFVIADSLTDYVRLTADRSYLSNIKRAVDNHKGLDGNDDDLWAVIASLNINRLAPSPRFLRFAQSNFDRIANSYWDDTCGGGIWWDHQRTYKNAITNELFLYAATSLYRATSDPTYSELAHREWKWFASSGLINNQGLINDGLDKMCANNGDTTYTYNQGVILGGLADLSSIDGDNRLILLATKLAKASIANLTTAEGILREPTDQLNQDSQVFKGIFAHHVGLLVPLIEDPQDRKIVSNFIVKNADHVWMYRSGGDGKLNSYWDGSHVLFGAAAQAAGINLFNAAIKAR